LFLLTTLASILCMSDSIVFVNWTCFATSLPPHAPAYVSIRQHTLAYVCIRRLVATRASVPPHAPAYVSIRQHTLAYVCIRRLVATPASVPPHAPAYVSIRQHTSAYVSIRVHTSTSCFATSLPGLISLPLKLLMYASLSPTV
jgi:hypothetical protein